MVEYYFALRVMANAYAKAGSHEVVSVLSPGSKVIWAPLNTNLDYADMALRYTMCQHLPADMALQWLTDNDDCTRGTMIQHMRNGYPQGEALSEAIREHRQDWKAVARAPTPPSKRQRVGGESPVKVSQPPNQRRELADTYRGRLICKKRHDQRGCAANENKCPDRRAHVCDVIKANGEVCGAKDHVRRDCPYNRW